VPFNVDAIPSEEPPRPKSDVDSLIKGLTHASPAEAYPLRASSTGPKIPRPQSLADLPSLPSVRAATQGPSKSETRARQRRAKANHKRKHKQAMKRRRHAPQAGYGGTCLMYKLGLYGQLATR
jgi:hypothetical protein